MRLSHGKPEDLMSEVEMEALILVPEYWAAEQRSDCEVVRTLGAVQVSISVKKEVWYFPAYLVALENTSREHLAVPPGGEPTNLPKDPTAQAAVTAVVSGAHSVAAEVAKIVEVAKVAG